MSGSAFYRTRSHSAPSLLTASATSLLAIAATSARTISGLSRAQATRVRRTRTVSGTKKKNRVQFTAARMNINQKVKRQPGMEPTFVSLM